VKIVVKFLVLVSAGLISAASAPRSYAQAPPLSITVELGDVSATKLPFIVAADNGIYEKNGLKVTQFITPAAAAAVRKNGVVVPPDFVRSGVVGDINIGGGSPTLVRMTSVATAPHRIILATTDNISRFHILSRPDMAKPEDLKGKRIGYGNPGALDQFSFIMFLRKMGWSPAHDVSMFSSGGAPKDVLEDRVDAFASDELGVYAAKKMGLKDLVDLRPYGFVMPGSGVNALAEWLPKNRDAAARFIKATVEAIALIQNDKQAALSSMKKWYGITDPQRLEAIYAEEAALPRKPYPSIEGLRNMQSIYDWREMEIRKPEDFVDSTFISDLDKSGFIDGLYEKNGGGARSASEKP
jgi:NitT/TauT family transport system substrate-binding protein